MPVLLIVVAGQLAVCYSPRTTALLLLLINVPLPGDTTTGKPYGIVTFTFRTGAAGSYYFQCFDPCGTGANGWEGPMVTKGYMHGTLTVQG